jgi:S-layer homology domain
MIKPKRFARVLLGLFSIVVVAQSASGPAAASSSNTTSSPNSVNYCDAIHAEYPAIVKVGSIYYTYYSGFSCSWQIYYAKSTDGIHFTKQGPINISSDWSTQRAYPFVIYEDGRFKMYYGGGYPYQIGYAESSDGVNFAALPQPVLTKGNDGDWDADQVLRPSIVEVTSLKPSLLQQLALAPSTSRLYMMYFNGFGPNDSAVGLAYSTDGTTWQRYSANPVVTSTTGIYTSFDLVVNGTSYLYYHTQDGIYLTLSPDGINFTPYSSDPILSPSGSHNWDTGQVYGQFVRQADDGSYTMYYNGIPVRDGPYGMIGIASSPDLIHYTPRVDNPAITVGNTPANFNAVASPDGRISASWHDVVTDAQSYELDYGVESGVYTTSLDVTSLEQVSFTVPESGDYYLAVVATTDGNRGYPAAERMVQVRAPSTPTPTTTTATATAAPATNTPTSTNTPAPAPSTATATSAPNTATTTATDTPTFTNTPAPTTDTPTFTNTPAPPTMTPTECPNPFIDITDNIFYTAILYLNCRGAVDGTDATHYSPANTSTRGQFAKVVVLGFGLPLFTPTDGTQDFVDVPSSYFAYAYIETGFHLGILSGFNQDTCTAYGVGIPCYLPELPITRGQLTKLVVNAGGYPAITPTGGRPDFTDVPPTNVFYGSIETAYHNAIIKGYPDNTFRPDKSIRRDEMAGIVYRAINTPSLRS